MEEEPLRLAIRSCQREQGGPGFSHIMTETSSSKVGVFKSGSSAVPEYEGGCHCGAVRFAVRVPLLPEEGRDSIEVVDCNCSMCTMKGFLHVIVPKDDFTLQKGEEQVAEYRFGTCTARHVFCKICGIHSFYMPRSHPNGVSVNANCLDLRAREGLIQLGMLHVKPFDGRNWEDNIKKLAS